jgi:hypothetical protein
MRYLLLAAAIIPLFPSMALAQSWQDWTRQNPTYPSLEPSPVPSVAPAPSVPAAPGARSRPPLGSTPMPFTTNNRPGLTLRSPEFAQGFMKGCTQNGNQKQKPYCACALRKLQDTYTTQEFASITQERFNSPAFRYEFTEKVIRPCAELLVR